MNIYVKLADYISREFDLQLPPHTADSAFVKIFETLLSEEEAELVCCLTENKENVRQISRRTGLNPNLLEEKLHDISAKGIIYEEADRSYHLMPFVPGIFEAVGAGLDGKAVAEYLKAYTREMSRIKAEYTGRRIEINEPVSTEVVHASMDDLSVYLYENDQFALMDCICRSIRQMEGHSCGHPIKDMCMIFGDYCEYYIRIGKARKATREEMIRLLQYAEDQGMYHEIYPVEKSGSAFVCNCCTCGCMFMGLANRIRKVTASGHRIVINPGKCTLCGKCVQNCPEQVFSFSENNRQKGGSSITADASRCFACGLCELVCDSQALSVE